MEKTARTLENTIRKEDPSRYTMMAYHNAPDLYERAHLTEIPMIMGWNLYQGWYEPDIDEFQRLLDRAHDKYKGKVLLVTEYGRELIRDYTLINRRDLIFLKSTELFIIVIICGK